MPPTQEIGPHAPKGSKAWLLHVLEKAWLDSFLPWGQEGVVRNADGFDLKAASNGRLDYIQTMTE